MRSSRLLPLLFLGFSGLYLTTLGPAFMDDDSAETITAGTALGIQHPPGYALDALWVRLWSLLPLGGPSFRVNVGSALLGALGVCLLYLLVRRALPLLNSTTSGTVLASLFGALCLGLSTVHWEKALGAKGGIYLIQEVLLLGVLYLRLTAPDKRGFLAACFLTGLGLANHWETQVLFLPLLFLFFWRWGPADQGPLAFSKGWAIRGMTFLALGASPLLLLPLRSHLDPRPDLGHPASLALFLKCVFRGYYDREPGLLGGLWDILRGRGTWENLGSLSLKIWRNQVSYIPVHFLKVLGPLCPVLALIGIFRVWGTDSRKVLGLVLLPLFTLLSSFFIALWVPLNVPHAWLMDNYLLPADALVCLLAGLAIGGAYGALERAQKAPSLLWFFLLVVLANGLLDYRRLDETRQTLRYDYGENLLRSLPRGSLFFAEGDEDHFPLNFFQIVQGQRPDVRMIPTFTLFETWGWDQVARSYPELGLGSREGVQEDPYHRIEAALGRLVANNRDRTPIGYSHFNGAFHRYYLQGLQVVEAAPSGNLLLVKAPGIWKVPILGPGGLRMRHFTDCPSNAHPSLTGIWGVYRSIGLVP